MVEYISDCVDCGFPCLGAACRHFRVKVLKCDKCRQEADRLYKYDGQELCEECVRDECSEFCETKERLDIVRRGGIDE